MGSQAVNPDEAFVLACGGVATLLLLCTATITRLRHSACAQATSATGKRRHTLATFAWVSRLLQWHVPPRRLWSHACGGLTVLGLILCCTWLAIMGVCLGNKLVKAWHKLQCQGVPGDDDGVFTTECLLASSLKRLDKLAQYLGTVVALQLGLMFYPVARSNVLQWLLGCEAAQLVRYHRWMGWSATATYSLHGLLYSYLWVGKTTWGREALLKPANVAGLLALMVGGVMAAMSTAWVRANHYQVFQRIHVLGVPLFLLATVVHSPKSVYYMLWGVLLYCVDRALRWRQWLCNRTSVSAVSGEDVGVVGGVQDGIVTLRTLWHKDSGIKPGQTLYLSAPAVSTLPAAHPFTVADVLPAAVAGRTTAGCLPGCSTSSTCCHSGCTSGRGCSQAGCQADDSSCLAGCPADSSSCLAATIHIKATGPWTHALMRHVRHSLAMGTPLQLQVEGPYGAGCQGLNLLPAAPVIVMVAGGIGVTPLLALLRTLCRQRAAPCSTTPAAQDPGSPAHTNPAASTVAAAAPAPPAIVADHVHFVFTARSLAELQLVDTTILDAAVMPWMGGAPWLSVTLAYTGFEQEREAESTTGVAVDVHSPACGAKGSAAAGTEQGTRLLQASPSASPWFYFALVVTTFAGGALGLMASVALDWCGRMHTCAFQSGPLSVGLTTYTLTLLGALVPCLVLLLLPLHPSRCTSQAPRSQSQSPKGQGLRAWGLQGPSRHPAAAVAAAGEDDEEAQQLLPEGPPEQLPQGVSNAGKAAAAAWLDGPIVRTVGPCGHQHAGVRVAPGYELQWGDNKSMKIHRGRPNLRHLLAGVQHHHHHHHHQGAQPEAPDLRSHDHHHHHRHHGVGTPAAPIPVLVGGPEAMWAHTSEVCAQLSQEAGKPRSGAAGRHGCGAVRLDPIQMAFTF